MLHSALLALAFGLFITGAFHKRLQVNFICVGLAVMAVAMFVGQDLHIHLHLNGESKTDTVQPTQMTYHKDLPTHSRS